MTDICQREDIKPYQVTLHSDNGSPMKGATMLATLQELGIIPSLMAHPERWSGGIMNWDLITEVHLNPSKTKKNMTENQVA